MIWLYQAIGIVFTSIPFIFAILLGAAFPILGVLSYQHFGAGTAIITGMFLLEALFIHVGGVELGMSLYFTDFVLVFIVVVAGLRFLFARDFPLRHRAWLLFCAVVAISFVSGLLNYGSNAGVQVRPYFYFIATGLYGMSFEIGERQVRFVLNLLAAAAIVLLLLTVYRWIVYFTPITDLLPPEGTYNEDGAIRVIRSNETLIIAQVVVAGLFFSGAAAGLRIALYLSPLLFGTVVALQHRSVWVALVAGIATRFLAVRSQRGSTRSQLLLLVAIATLAILPLAFSDKVADVSTQVQKSAVSAVTGKGTAGERLESWGAIVAKLSAAGPRAMLIGQSFGSDISRYVHDEQGRERKIDYAAHNLYVQTLYNTGVIGLSAMLTAFAYILRGLYRISRDGRGGVETNLLLVLMVTQMVYYIPYGVDYIQSLLFGVSLAYVAVKSRESPIESARSAAPASFPPRSLRV